MATLSFVINDAHVPRMTAALCALYNLTPTAANARSVIRLEIIKLITEYEQRAAQQTAINGISPVDLT